MFTIYIQNPAPIPSDYATFAEYYEAFSEWERKNYPPGHRKTKYPYYAQHKKTQAKKFGKAADAVLNKKDSEPKVKAATKQEAKPKAAKLKAALETPVLTPIRSLKTGVPAKITMAHASYHADEMLQHGLKATRKYSTEDESHRNDHLYVTDNTGWIGGYGDRVLTVHANVQNPLILDTFKDYSSESAKITEGDNPNKYDFVGWHDPKLGESEGFLVNASEQVTRMSPLDENNERQPSPSSPTPMSVQDSASKLKGMTDNISKHNQAEFDNAINQVVKSHSLAELKKIAKSFHVTAGLTSKGKVSQKLKEAFSSKKQRANRGNQIDALSGKGSESENKEPPKEQDKVDSMSLQPEPINMQTGQREDTGTKQLAFDHILKDEKELAFDHILKDDGVISDDSGKPREENPQVDTPKDPDADWNDFLGIKPKPAPAKKPKMSNRDPIWMDAMGPGYEPEDDDPPPPPPQSKLKVSLKPTITSLVNKGIERIPEQDVKGLASKAFEKAREAFKKTPKLAKDGAEFISQHGADIISKIKQEVSSFATGTANVANAVAKPFAPIGRRVAPVVRSIGEIGLGVIMAGGVVGPAAAAYGASGLAIASSWPIAVPVLAGLATFGASMLALKGASGLLDRTLKFITQSDNDYSDLHADVTEGRSTMKFSESQDIKRVVQKILTYILQKVVEFQKVKQGAL